MHRQGIVILAFARATSSNSAFTRRARILIRRIVCTRRSTSLMSEFLPSCDLLLSCLRSRDLECLVECFLLLDPGRLLLHLTGLELVRLLVQLEEEEDEPLSELLELDLGGFLGPRPTWLPEATWPSPAGGSECDCEVYLCPQKAPSQGLQF